MKISNMVGWIVGAVLVIADPLREDFLGGHDRACLDEQRQPVGALHDFGELQRQPVLRRDAVPDQLLLLVVRANLALERRAAPHDYRGLQG